MSKTRDTGFLGNVVKVDASGNVSFVSGSTTLATINTTGQLSGSSPVLSSSYALNATSASYAVSASNATNAITASYANAFTVANTLTAQTLVVQTITSSVLYSSGSNVFGNNIANTQTFTGSMNLTGSLSVVTNGTEFQVNASGVKFGNVSTDSHSITGSLLVSGSIGIGYTSPTVALQVSGTIAVGNATTTGWGRFLYDTATNQVRIQASKDGTDSIGLSFYTQASGGGFAERMIISGSNVGIGTSSPNALLQVTSAAFPVLKVADGIGGGALALGDSTITSNYVGIWRGAVNSISGGGFLNIQGNGIAFMSSDNVFGAGSERMRIVSAGWTKISNNGTYLSVGSPYHEIYSNQNNNAALVVTNSNNTYPYGVYMLFTTASPNDSTRWFYNGEDSTATRFIVRSNGGIVNYQANDTNLSDIRTKKDISLLGSYWNKLKALEIVKFKYKDQTHDDFNIGVIAQQVEEVAPEFVDVDGFGKIPEDGIPYKTIYTADLHHATIKVLQEAMAKIETLETENDTLKEILQRNNIQ